MRLRFVCAVVAVILVGTLHLLASLSGSPVAILVTGGLVCLVPYYGLWPLLEAEPPPDVDAYLPGIATLLGVMLSGSVRGLAGLSQSLLVDWLAVLLAAVSSGLLIAIRLWARQPQCGRCRQPVAPPASYCPRCDRRICRRTRCWVRESHRCTDCARYEVPLFPSQEDWWQVRLGPRLVSGRCQRCGQEARVCNLRRCGQCPWAMCTLCWDLENGRCLRCHWRMPDLPKSLEQQDGNGVRALPGWRGGMHLCIVEGSKVQLPQR